MPRRGSPRKLRPEEGQSEVDHQQKVDIQTSPTTEVTETVEEIQKPKEVQIRTESDPFPDVIPYDPNEGLPKAKYRTTDGKRVLIERGEPRYYFNPNGQELIRVYQATTKKTELAVLLRINSPNQQVATKARKMRNHLLRKGVPIRGREFQSVRTNG